MSLVTRSVIEQTQAAVETATVLYEQVTQLQKDIESLSYHYYMGAPWRVFERA